eukprot:6844497-Pyramimonas_sp.AAC.1
MLIIDYLHVQNHKRRAVGPIWEDPAVLALDTLRRRPSYEGHALPDNLVNIADVIKRLDHVIWCWERAQTSDRNWKSRCGNPYKWWNHLPDVSQLYQLRAVAVSIQEGASRFTPAKELLAVARSACAKLGWLLPIRPSTGP